MSDATYGVLPKTIWMYWHKPLDQAPALVRLCHASWVRHNKDWNVVILDGDPSKACLSATGVVHKIPADIPINHQSDLLRCALLVEAGGVWVDATCLCVRPLTDWIFDVLPSGFFAFRDPGRDRILSSWFLASVPGCGLLRSFSVEHERFWVENRFPNQNTQFRRRIRRMLSTILNRNPILAMAWLLWPVRKFLHVYPYYIFHYHFAVHIAKNKDARAIFNAMPFYSTEGPHMLQVLSRNRDLSMSEIKLALLCFNPPVYKLTWKENIFQRDDLDLERFLAQALGAIHW